MQFLPAAYRGISMLGIQDYYCVGCNNAEVRNNIHCEPNANECYASFRCVVSNVSNVLFRDYALFLLYEYCSRKI